MGYTGGKINMAAVSVKKVYWFCFFLSYWLRSGASYINQSQNEVKQDQSKRELLLKRNWNRREGGGVSDGEVRMGPNFYAQNKSNSPVRSVCRWTSAKVRHKIENLDVRSFFINPKKVLPKSFYPKYPPENFSPKKLPDRQFQTQERASHLPITNMFECSLPFPYWKSLLRPMIWNRMREGWRMMRGN